MRKIFALLISFIFMFEQTGFAQMPAVLDLSPVLSAVAVEQIRLRPPHLRCLVFNGATNMFEGYIDKGSAAGRTTAVALQKESAKLYGYFLTGLSVPGNALWVNLRPDAADMIISPALEDTDVGKIMLEADVQLKKDIARLTSPQTPSGKHYWDALYKKAETLQGSVNSIPTVARPWIVPDEIVIGESKTGAYVYKATLKVQLEQDRLANSTIYNLNDTRLKTLNDYSAKLLKATIIPQLTKEVNASPRYASLRQVYYSLIIAEWFKKHRMTSAMHVSTGPRSAQPWSKTAYFNTYKTSFINGEYRHQQRIDNGQSTRVRTCTSGGVIIDIANARSIPLTSVNPGPNCAAITLPAAALAPESINIVTDSIAEPTVKKDAGQNEISLLKTELSKSGKSVNSATVKTALSNLFATASATPEQAQALKIASRIESNPGEVIKQIQASGITVNAPPESLSAAAQEAISEAIMAGQLYNSPEALLLTDKDFTLIKYLSQLRSRNNPNNQNLISQAAKTIRDSVKNKTISGIAAEYNLKFPRLLKNADRKRKISTFTGGTAVGTVLKDALKQANLLIKSAIDIVVGNSDDGGGSFTLIQNAKKAGFGILPPPGDQVNALAGFASDDKRLHLLSDQGRLEKSDPSLLEGLLILIEKTVNDEKVKSSIVKIDDDFGLFALSVLVAAEKLDAKSDLFAAQDPQIAFEKKRFVPIDGASIRNLILWGALDDTGFFDMNKRGISSDDENKDVKQADYKKATDMVITLFGVARSQQLADIELSVSSFTPHTLYAVYEGWNLLLKGKESTSIVIVPTDDTYTLYVPDERGMGKQHEIMLNKGEKINLASEWNIATDENVTISNEDGKLFVSNFDTKLFDVSEKNKHTFIKFPDSPDKTQIADDGTGRDSQYEGDTKPKALLTLQNGTELFFRSRLNKMQTNITETLNYSKIVEFGKLDKTGLAGQIPNQNPPLQPSDIIKKLDNAKKGDFIVIGPGSFFTSILPHFFVDGFGKKLEEAKQREVTVVFIFGSNIDNETINLTPRDLIKKIEDTSGRPFDSMFSHMIIGRSDLVDLIDLSPEATVRQKTETIIKKLNEGEEETRNGISGLPVPDALIHELQGIYGKGFDLEKVEEARFILGAYLKLSPLIQENLQHSTGDLDRYELLHKYMKEVMRQTKGSFRELVDTATDNEWEAFRVKIAILAAIAYYKRHAEVRTDASKGSEGAKKSIELLVLTPEERAELEKLDMKIIEISANGYLKVAKRVQGEYTLRIGFDEEILSAAFKDINKDQRAVWNKNSTHYILGESLFNKRGETISDPESAFSIKDTADENNLFFAGNNLVIKEDKYSDATNWHVMKLSGDNPTLLYTAYGCQEFVGISDDGQLLLEKITLHHFNSPSSTIHVLYKNGRQEKSLKDFKGSITLLSNGEWTEEIDGKKTKFISNSTDKKNEGKLGGIDFRKLPELMNSRVIADPKTAAFRLSEMKAKWNELKYTLRFGKFPGEELKEIVLGARNNADAGDLLKAVTFNLAAVLRDEETEAKETSAEMKELLALLR